MKLPKIVYLLSLLLALLLSACSMLQKVGIEKRRYRPGFNIDMESKEANNTPVSNSTASNSPKKLLEKIGSKSLTLPNQVLVPIKKYTSSLLTSYTHKDSKAGSSKITAITQKPNYSSVDEQVSTKEDAPESVKRYNEPGTGEAMGIILLVLLIAGLVVLLIYGIGVGLEALFPAVSIGVFIGIVAVILLVLFIIFQNNGTLS